MEELERQIKITTERLIDRAKTFLVTHPKYVGLTAVFSVLIAYKKHPLAATQYGIIAIVTDTISYFIPMNVDDEIHLIGKQAKWTTDINWHIIQ